MLTNVWVLWVILAALYWHLRQSTVEVDENAISFAVILF